MVVNVQDLIGKFAKNVNHHFSPNVDPIGWIILSGLAGWCSNLLDPTARPLCRIQ